MHNFLKFFNIPHFHWKQKSLFIDFMCLHLSLTRWSPKLGSWIVAQKKRWTRQINKIPNSIFQPFSFFGSFSCFDAHLRDWSEKVSSSSGASKWGEGEEMKIKELFFEEMKKTNKKVFSSAPKQRQNGWKSNYCLIDYCGVVSCLLCGFTMVATPFHLHVHPHSYCFRISFYCIFWIEKNSLPFLFLLFQCKFEGNPLGDAWSWRHKRNFLSILSSSETFSLSLLTWTAWLLKWILLFNNNRRW